ncbi:hypothetical protein F5X96DRAFT_140410 [Biscogniauxia mediterranea]|nr:hypothetical protein F5X96DRAFT_140410 [Biscogniauxia mediterranea]
MKTFHHILFQSLILFGLALAGRAPRGISSVAPSPPSPPQRPSTAPASIDLVAVSTPSPSPSPSPSPASNSPKCGKGYTYCGYLLTGEGHNFPSSDVTKAYCSGLPDLCPSGKPRTDASQAVYYCLNDQPSTIRLLCACGGKCLNNPETNHIAHCDKPCVNT